MVRAIEERFIKCTAKISIQSTDCKAWRCTHAKHANAYRRIESIAQVKGSDKLRVLDLKRQDVRDAVAVGQDAEALFSSGLADDYQ